MRSTAKFYKGRLLLLAFSLILLLITIKLFYIQVVSPISVTVDYVKTRKILPERGRLFDRNGYPLAANQIIYNAFAEPKIIKDRDKFIRKLSPLLGMEEASLEGKLDSRQSWVRVKKGIDEKTKSAIEKLGFPGIGFDEEYKRYYPESSLSAHLLGFVGKNNNGDDTGYSGIEGYYDQDLSGLPGLMRSETDLAGRSIFFGTQNRIEPENGRDLYLTIDKSVQQIIKDRLKWGMEAYKATQGCVIVADPNTMEIIGMTCLPDYDPDKYYDFNESDYTNPAISNTYEPGSTFKPLIVSAALEEKAIRPDETYNETGPTKVGEYSIRTWNNEYGGWMSITDILKRSSNVGMVYIGAKLGNNELYQYISNYGFGKATGIDLQGEVDGLLKPRSQWYPIDYATATFGQGLAVTPMQMVTAFSAMVNGGDLLQPHIVYRAVGVRGEKKVERKIVRKIISGRTSEIIKKMLQNTVEGGEVKWARPEGYSIGGKTGTAQIPIAGHYDPSKTIASFIGFAPVDKPKFVALVMLREPKSSQWGSETAAPLFFQIAKELIVYYNIAPDKGKN